MLICAGGLGLASLLGSTVGLAVRKIPHRWNDIFLGFCAGMMLTASLVCLIVPAVDMAGRGGWWQPLLGVVMGVLLIAVLDKFTPHLHHLTGLGRDCDGEEPHTHYAAQEPHTHNTVQQPHANYAGQEFHALNTGQEPHSRNSAEEPHAHNRSINRILLFVMAIAIHKFPEGLATGVIFDGNDLANAYTVAITIALQNIPEGMVVVTPLLMIGVRYLRVIGVGLAVALMEIAGVLLGYFIGDISAALLPVMTALAGGAMLYVISDEMIPETHSHGFEKPATYALVAGVMCMLYIQMFV